MIICYTHLQEDEDEEEEVQEAVEDEVQA